MKSRGGCRSFRLQRGRLVWGCKVYGSRTSRWVWGRGFFKLRAWDSSLVKTFYCIHNAFKELGCSSVKLYSKAPRRPLLLT